MVFWDEHIGSDEIKYAMTPIRGDSELCVEQADENTYVMRARAIRPYPPGHVLVNSTSYLDLEPSSEVIRRQKAT